MKNCRKRDRKKKREQSRYVGWRRNVAEDCGKAATWKEVRHLEEREGS